VRYPLIALLVVLMVLGIVAFARGRVPAAVIRTVLIVTLVPLLLAPFQRWGLRRRAQRLAPRFAADLGRLQDRIAQERHVELARRTSGASDEALSAAADAVAEARNQLAGGDEREAAERVQAVPRSWTGDLGDDLARCQASARTILKTNRRADKLRR
jgi:hypothetical protein